MVASGASKTRVRARRSSGGDWSARDVGQVVPHTPSQDACSFAAGFVCEAAHGEGPASFLLRIFEVFKL